MNRGPRKRIRLLDYDYSKSGTYFVTVCTTSRAPIFWQDIPSVGQGLCPCLSPRGIIVEEELKALLVRFSTLWIEKYVVMPDHIHVLLTLKRQGQSPCPTLGAVIGAFKSISTKRINREQGTPGEKIWQARYYEHIVRNEDDFLSICQYIKDNPARWLEEHPYGL